MDNALEAKMGATDNKNASRLAELEARKKQIEETLAKRTQELRELCLKEADLTGIIPLEMPLEPGESFPSLRRRVGTSYQLPESLLKNSNKDEIIADLELQIQVEANLAKAASGLAKEANSSKTLRRKHLNEYEQHEKLRKKLQEQLNALKEKNAEQQKQKKKPRGSEQDDNVSVNTSMNESFPKTDLRHSLRSNKHSTTEHNIVEQNYLSGSRYSVRNEYLEQEINRNDDMGIYRLSLNGYKNYMERRENNNISYMMQDTHLTHNHSPHYQPHSPNLSSHSPLLHSPHNYQHSPQLHPRSPQLMYNYPPHYNQAAPPPYFNRHSSPTTQQTNTKTSNYYQQSHPIAVQQQQTSNYRQYDVQYRNPHQIQPHQQYEQMTAGLGGCWKRSESGEMIWCNQTDSNWQRDKRSGSLDRRKNRRIHKRIPPFVDTKSATISSMPNYPEHVRTASIKSSQIVSRRSHDNRQLVRTQSLGSVGAQTVDSVYASDDNSSFDSNDNRCFDMNNTMRKHKEKEWLETSLDGPISSIQPVAPLILAPEEKYHPPPPPPPPKPPLEIPAESNPSPRLPEKNLEMFNNNNISKNFTIVEAGHCKPYHEETKPFEMSDFYKYSTKFKKSPNKQQDNVVKHVEKNPNVQINLANSFNDVEQYQNLSPMYKYQHNSPGMMDSPTSLNASLDLSHLAISEHFSAEMNAWYKGQEHKTVVNNNSGESNSKNRSTAATLV